MTQQLELDLFVNGVSSRVTVEPRATLADTLREQLGLTGTHLGCEQGVCGSCTVLVDGMSARSCLILAAGATERSIETVEGFGPPEAINLVREAFARHHALQCGFCTPGFIATVIEMMREQLLPDEKEVRERLSGNLCRCTGYQNIVAAAIDVLSLST